LIWRDIAASNSVRPRAIPHGDGNRIAVRAMTQQGGLVASRLTFRFARNFQISIARFPEKQLCGISPLGGTLFANRSISRIKHCSRHRRQPHPELDRTSSARPWRHDGRCDGSEVYVGISKSNPDKYQVIKRRPARLDQPRLLHTAGPTCLGAGDTPPGWVDPELMPQSARAALSVCASPVRSEVIY